LDRLRPSGARALRRHNYQTLFLNPELDFIVETNLVDNRFGQSNPSRVSDAN
jgi:hypothetical protein